MKKLLGAFGVACILILSGCGHFVSIMPGTEADLNEELAQELPGLATEEPEDVFRQTPIYSFMGWQDFGSSYYDHTPVALSVAKDGGAPSPVFDRTSIIAACDAMRTMTVTGQVEGEPSGAETVFTFTMPGGEQQSVTFVDGMLKLYTGLYTVEGGESLWDIKFPCYDEGFGVFDLYYSEEMRAFADNFETALPLSVGRRSNGGAALASQEEDVIRQVFSLLRNAKVSSVEASPDQNIDLTETTDYVFTMSDASSYTVTFTGPCLTVTVSEDYGPVYYWLEGVDELADMTILPKSTVPTFDGGAVTGLREEIAEARAAAAGELDDVTVVGVYVDYLIDGKEGYLTLSGDTANKFVIQATSITATSEKVEASGETITVFITLSDDASAPILVFTGDTVQQMVGINYPCDSGEMQSLRSRILELAKDELNVSSMVEESSTS